MTKETMKELLMTFRKDGKYLDIERLAEILSELINDVAKLKKQ